MTPSHSAPDVTIFLCGDVMTGRGIDQILPHPGDPQLYEPYVRSALDYVALAEEASGAIPRPVDFAYIWGEAREEFARMRPAAGIVNLETAVSLRGRPESKGINYRMNPANLPCLASAAIDCCVLANNHVLDWGVEGLADTLDALDGAGLKRCGAGRTLAEAQGPAVIGLAEGARLLVFGFGMASSGIPSAWAAAEDKAGLDLLPDLSGGTVSAIARRVSGTKRPRDIAVASIHWGGNWGYRISDAERVFARALVDRAGIDVVHGHSSHHAKAIEVRNGKLILYGCGDFIDDYEGIGGYEEFRPNLAVMYFPTLALADGRLQRLDLIVLKMRKFRLTRAEPEDARWLADILTREGQASGSTAVLRNDGTIALQWR